MQKQEVRNKESKNRKSKVHAAIAHPNKLVSNRKYRSSINGANRTGKSQYKNSNLRPQRPSDTDNKLSKRNNKRNHRERMDANGKKTTYRRARDGANLSNRSKGQQRAGRIVDDTSNTYSKKRETNAAGNARRGNVKRQNGRTRNPANRRSKRG